MSTVQDFLRELDQGAISVTVDDTIGTRHSDVFVDIREDHELSSGIIPSAVIIPRGRLEIDYEAHRLHSASRVIIYCASGTRSLLAVHSLRSIGFHQAYSLSGGFSAWVGSAGSVEPYRALTADEKVRYARQIQMPEIGLRGQLRLQGAHIAVVGAGGLGSPAAIYLAAAGIGTLSLIDDDVVDLSNLHRQILHRTAGIGKSKVGSAKEFLGQLNPQIRLVPHECRVNADNVDHLLSDADIIIDGSDNLETRALLNTASQRLQKPLIYGAVERFRGQISVFGLPDGPCYRCVYPQDPPASISLNCADAGVLGVLPGIVGSFQAAEALKLILGAGEPLAAKILNIDLENNVCRTLSVRRRHDCAICKTAA